MNYLIKLKRGNAERWSVTNPLLEFGEPAICLANNGDMIMKIGDGNRRWNQLPTISNTKHVEKDYVDNAISQLTTNTGNTTSYNFSNGLYYDGEGNVTLGGDLNSNVTIPLNGNSYIIGHDSSGTGPYLVLMDTQNYFIGNRNDNFTAEIQIDEPFGIYFYHSNNNDLNFGVRLQYNALSYDNDYSQYFNERSLVDKAYVDNLMSNISNGNTTSYNFINGLVLDNSNVSLGGQINGTIRLNIDGNNADNNFMILSTYNDYSNYMFNCYSGFIFEQGNFVTNNQDAGLYLACNDGLTTRGAFVTRFGLRYRDNYSSDWDDRYLVDKGYVDNAIANINGGGNNTIDLSNYTVANNVIIGTTGAGLNDGINTITFFRQFDNGQGTQNILFNNSSYGDAISLVSNHNTIGSSYLSVYSDRMTFGVYSGSIGSSASVLFDVNGLKYEISNPSNWDGTYLVDKNYVDNAISNISYTNGFNVNTQDSINITTLTDNNIATTSTQTINIFRGSNMDFNQSIYFGYTIGTDDYILFQNNASPSTGGKWSNLWFGYNDIRLENSNFSTPLGNTTSTFSLDYNGISLSTSNNIGSFSIMLSSSGLTYTSFGQYFENTLVPKSYVDSKLPTYYQTNEPTIDNNTIGFWRNISNDEIFLIVNIEGLQKKVLLS